MNALAELTYAARHGVVSIGNFDGVHRGHAMLIDRLCQLAKKLKAPSVILTFDPHPSAILYPETAVTPLTTPTRRAQLLKQLGVEKIVICPTDRQLLALDAQEFFLRVISEHLAAKGLVEGPNFFFGRGRGGNVQLLDQLCRDSKIAFEVVAAETTGEGMVSSTRVRQHLRAGEIEAANGLLTAPYQIIGVVCGGEQRGRKLGFPTANLSEIPVLVPSPGVYAATVELAGIRYAAATHIGPNPTFDQPQQKVEVHVMGFSGDLYGQRMTVDFHARVRDIARFASPDALREQLARDLANVKRLTASWIEPSER